MIGAGLAPSTGWPGALRSLREIIGIRHLSMRLCPKATGSACFGTWRSGKLPSGFKKRVADHIDELLAKMCKSQQGRSLSRLSLKTVSKRQHPHIAVFATSAAMSTHLTGSADLLAVGATFLAAQGICHRHQRDARYQVRESRWRITLLW